MGMEALRTGFWTEYSDCCFRHGCRMVRVLTL